MRKDENGNECPETLGEYRAICVGLGGEECEAVKFLDKKIEEDPDGKGGKVIAPDSQMRLVLFPMLLK